MKNNYFIPLVLMLFFSFCTKKESDAIQPNNIEEQLIGRWKEVETTVKEYDSKNNLLKTTPNLSPISVVFDGKQVKTTYTEPFIPESTTQYKISKVNNRLYVEFEGDTRLAEITEFSATNLTLVVKQMGSEFNGATFEYMLYTRKLIKL
jgi:hypothetical protein